MAFYRTEHPKIDTCKTTISGNVQDGIVKHSTTFSRKDIGTAIYILGIEVNINYDEAMHHVDWYIAV